MTIELFAHRGFTDSKKLQENSPESLQRAYEVGFRAVEFDVWLVDGKLVLKHDKPKVGELLPQFASYLRYVNHLKYWIDFKNLNLANCDEFLSLIKNDIKKSQIDLQQIFFAPFITDYVLAEKIYAEIRKSFGKSANVVGVCEDAAALVELPRFLAKNQLKFLSINHLLLDEKVVKTLSEIQLLAWTVNDLARLQELEKLGVTAIATDQIKP